MVFHQPKMAIISEFWHGKRNKEYSHLAVAVCEDQNDLLFQFPHSDAC